MEYHPLWVHTRRYVVAELIVELLLYETPEHHKFVTMDRIRGELDYEPAYANEFNNAVRALVVIGVLEYTHVRGQYRIVDVEKFFDADKIPRGEWERRWKEAYTR